MTICHWWNRSGAHCRRNEEEEEEDKSWGSVEELEEEEEKWVLRSEGQVGEMVVVYRTHLRLSGAWWSRV